MPGTPACGVDGKGGLGCVDLPIEAPRPKAPAPGELGRPKATLINWIVMRFMATFTLSVEYQVRQSVRQR